MRRTLEDTSLVEVLVSGMDVVDPVIRMRCADALEKVTATVPGIAQRFSTRILALLSHAQPKEVLWHLLQIAPRISWSPQQLPVVLAALAAAHKERSSIVKACALQAEVELLAQAPDRRRHVAGLVREACNSGAPAVRARARKLFASLEGRRPSSRRRMRDTPRRDA